MSADSSVVAPVARISPLVDIELGGGGGGDITPVDGISPARAMPQSAHARTTANVKRLIRSVFSFEFCGCQCTGKKQDKCIYICGS